MNARLEPLEVFILDFFRRRSSTRVAANDLRAHGIAYGNPALGHALQRLEEEERFLARSTAEGVEWLELTRDGRRYAGLAALETEERLEPR